MNAGVGNLIAEGNQKNTMKVFWELTAIRFLIVGFVVFGLLLFVQPFIACWFGQEYLLSNIILYLLIFNIFIMLSRGVVEMYIGACGLFSDVWAAWTELIVNICVTLCLAPFLGIIGILLGKIISIFFIAIFWKPYFLFTKGLHMPVSDYWRGMLPYYLIFSLFILIIFLIKSQYFEHTVDSLFKLIGYGIITYIPIMIAYTLSLLWGTKGMRYFVARKPYVYNQTKKYFNI
jgi:O-antigen/teichoic acid export membrane protein